MTTRDEALKRAILAMDMTFNVEASIHAFDRSLRADGWTLVPVEATDEMLNAALAVAASEAGEPLETFSLKQINAAKAKAIELWTAMLEEGKRR